MSIINIDTLKNFLESQYARQLIFKTDNVEIILMCWLPEQGTPIHNHGKSDAITLILEGEMTYTTHYPDNSKVSGVLRAGDIEHIPVGIEHEVKNSSKNKLVTLHAYSPPLEQALISQTLGYSNEVKLKQIQVCEKVVSYLVADKPMVDSVRCENKKPIVHPVTNGSSKRPTVAIIGGGFSGSLVATHLMKKSVSEPLQIVLIERAPKFARGFAYSTNSPLHLLNVPAGKMSAFPNDSEHFLRWVQNRDLNINLNSFVSRMLYGEYLESVLFEAEINKVPSTNFKRIHDEAISIEIEEENNRKRTKIVLESGIQIPADKVVLAVGNYLPRNPNVKQTSFYGSKRYIRDPWSANALSMIAPDDPILLIGTGLTMIDKAIELKCRGHRGIINAISRHGLLPQPHKLDIKHIEINFNFENSSLTIRELSKLIREKIKYATKNGSDWRLVFDSLRPHLQKIWVELSTDEKKRFFRHVRPYWDVHRHRMPNEVAKVINSLMESKQLIIHKGRIKDYEEKEDFVSVLIQKSFNKTDKLEVTRIVNCTGSELDFCQIQDPLIVGLFEKGLIASDKLSLGLDASSVGELKDANGNISKVFYTLGPPLKGQLWETTAVPEIREQALVIANELLKSLAKVTEESLAKV